jgi:outer membrane immunogenic protein
VAVLQRKTPFIQAARNRSTSNELAAWSGSVRKFPHKFWSKLMRRLFVAALMAAAIATPAFAQDANPFTGPRIEGVVGWDRPKASGDRADGVGFGLGAGYDLQVGGAVVGAEVEATASTAKSCTDNVVVVGDELCLKAKRDLYAGGRVGIVAAPKTLVFAKAGYTNARTSLDYDDGGSGASDTSAATNLDGVRVGAGVEHAIGTKSYVKGEYRYSNYERGFERHQLLAGVGIRF